MSGDSTFVIASEVDLRIDSESDLMDAIGHCFGGTGLLLIEKDVSADFFDLRTGLAGAAMQKFINYQVRVAIVIENPARYGERFEELAYEHSAHPQVRITTSRTEAEAWLST